MEPMGRKSRKLDLPRRSTRQAEIISPLLHRCAPPINAIFHLVGSPHPCPRDPQTGGRVFPSHLPPAEWTCLGGTPDRPHQCMPSGR